jgi:hypothetical protein
VPISHRTPGVAPPAARRARRGGGLLLAAALAACDRLTAPQALRAAERAARVGAVDGGGSPTASLLRGSFPFRDRPPLGTPLTVLVDGTPVEYRAVVFEEPTARFGAPGACAGSRSATP